MFWKTWGHPGIPCFVGALLLSLCLTDYQNNLMYGTIIQIPSLFHGKVNIMLNLLSSVVIFTSHVDILKCFSDKMLYMHEIEEDMLEVTQLPITG